MQILVKIPSKQQTFNITIAKDENVSEFRQRIQKKLQLPSQSFILIALGKVLLDCCSDNAPAKLTSTYRIRDKTCIIVHVKPTDNAKNVIDRSSKRKRRSRGICVGTARSDIMTSSFINNGNNGNTNDGSIKKLRTGLRSSTYRSATAASPSSSYKHSPTPSTSRSIITDNRVITTPFESTPCIVCNNDKRIRKCSECGCAKCLLKTGDPLICDQCDQYWHLKCAGLRENPVEEYWYCPDCYNSDKEVIIGKDTPISHSVNTLYQTFGTSARDTECVIVKRDHIGKIPGVYCGQTWASRNLAMDWGVHRSNVRAVVGASNTGCVSLCLSHPIKEDRDLGYEFIFSGVYGTSEMYATSNDGLQNLQTLTSCNRALALTCYAPFDDEKGAKSTDWKKSRPIRVCRHWKWGKVHPEFAPATGLRYDGLYKLVKYWPYKVKSTGNIVWKFLFRRDDPEAPPWSIAGKSNITKRGLRMILDYKDEMEKLVKYKIPAPVLKLIDQDQKNSRLWKEIKALEFHSEYEFLHYIFDTAIVCSSHACTKPIQSPVTTPCGHICCLRCLQQSSTNECFECRGYIPPTKAVVNERLIAILKALNYAYFDERFEKNPYRANRYTLPCIQWEDDHDKAMIVIKLEHEGHDSSSKNKTLTKFGQDSKSNGKTLRAVVRIVPEDDIKAQTASNSKNERPTVHSIKSAKSLNLTSENLYNSSDTPNPSLSLLQKYTKSNRHRSLPRSDTTSHTSDSLSNTCSDAEGSLTDTSIYEPSIKYVLDVPSTDVFTSTTAQSYNEMTELAKQPNNDLNHVNTIMKASKTEISTITDSLSVKARELSQQNGACESLYPFNETILTNDACCTKIYPSHGNLITPPLKNAAHESKLIINTTNEYFTADHQVNEKSSPIYIPTPDEKSVNLQLLPPTDNGNKEDIPSVDAGLLQLCRKAHTSAGISFQ